MDGATHILQTESVLTCEANSAARIRCATLHGQRSPIRLAVAQGLSHDLPTPVYVQQVHVDHTEHPGSLYDERPLGHCECSSHFPNDML